ncbi:MAG: fatty acid desaturase, partial [Pseudomonadales bacterium]
GTAFRTKWLNRLFYELSSFMTLREAYLWRYSHTRHHTHTIIVGQDPEIQATRPADLLKLALNFFFVISGPIEMRRIIRHAFRGLGEDEKVYVPENARKRLIRSSRIYVALWSAIVLWCIAIGSVLPVMFVVLPRFYGGWLHQLLGLTQHAGLAENVSDHRQNTRTVYLNPVFRFLYMNMNYHIEHHVSPTVPYHALPALHEEIKAQCPPAYQGVWPVYREMLPALARQAFGEPDFHIARGTPKAVP